jgi:hypothetical protein
VMTDNGSSFRSRRYAKALRRLRIRQNQRKGRAVRPDQLARMGLRASLQHLRTTRPRAACLAPPLQLASPPWQYWLQAANQQDWTKRGQPLEAPHLARAFKPRVDTDSQDHRHRDDGGGCAGLCYDRRGSAADVIETTLAKV